MAVMTNGAREPKNVGGFLVRRRLSFESEFTQIPNAYLRDRRLSYKARGVLAILMSHTHGHEVSLKQLAKDAADEHSGTEGVAGVRTAVAELERHGYLSRQKVRGRGGVYATRWELTEPTAPMFEVAKSTTYENRTPSPTAFENRTRTAFENRTHKEHHLRTSIKTSQSDHSTHAQTNEDASGDSHQPASATPAPDFEPCPKGKGFRPHSYAPATGRCIDCGAHDPALTEGAVA